MGRCAALAMGRCAALGLLLLALHFCAAQGKNPVVRPSSKAPGGLKGSEVPQFVIWRQVAGAVASLGNATGRGRPFDTGQ